MQKNEFNNDMIRDPSIDLSIIGLDRPDLIFLLGAFAFWFVSIFLFKESCTYSVIIFRNILFEKILKIEQEKNIPENESRSAFERAEVQVSHMSEEGIGYYINKLFSIHLMSGSSLLVFLPFILLTIVIFYLFSLNMYIYQNQTSLISENIYQLNINNKELTKTIFLGLLLKPSIISAILFFSSFVNIVMAIYKFITMSALSNKSQEYLHDSISIIPSLSKTGLVGALFSMIGLLGSLASIYGLSLYLLEKG